LTSDADTYSGMAARQQLQQSRWKPIARLSCGSSAVLCVWEQQAKGRNQGHILQDLMKLGDRLQRPTAAYYTLGTRPTVSQTPLLFFADLAN